MLFSVDCYLESKFNVFFYIQAFKIGRVSNVPNLGLLIKSQEKEISSVVPI